ncbi:hypothetical protein [Xanthomonas massiliensis]|jgi:hypothetical protein|nr:hypothetical protein [Xanthomonas massiliensis]
MPASAPEGRRWEDLERYIGLTAGVLDAYRERIERSTALLGG